MRPEDIEGNGVLLSPAINLLGSVLTEWTFFKYNGDKYRQTFLIPEFSIDSFFKEYETFNSDDEVDPDTMEIYYPNIKRYVLDCIDNDYSDLEKYTSIEIEWAAHFPVVGFPQYVYGYEFKTY